MSRVEIMGWGELTDLYGLQPKGLGTGQVQSLTSYIVDLANEHSVRPAPLITRVLLPKAKLSQVWNSGRRASAFLINGYRNVAHEFFGAVQEATADSAHRSMTCLPWANALDGRGKNLLHATRLWCSACYREQLERGEYCWDPLLWSLRPVDVCPRHRRPLSSSCNRCGRRQLHITLLPVINRCDYCGASLETQRVPRERSGPETAKVSAWYASACEDLIAADLRPEEATGANFKINLDGIIAQHFQRRHAAFSRAIGLPRVRIKAYSWRLAVPSFTPLLDLCYRLDVPPRALLTSSCPITDPSLWRRHTQRAFRRAPKKLSARREERIRGQLAKLIAARRVTEGGLKGVAKNIRLSVQQLRYRFPREAEKIVKLGAERRTAANVQRAREREERREKAVSIVLGKQRYPSERQLKATGLVKPSDLRRKSRE